MKREKIDHIGIVGQGFVGSAIKEGLKSHYTVRGYDLDPKKCFNLKRVHKSRLEELAVWSDIVFVCVPTPMRKDCSCDTRILENAIEELDVACINAGRSDTRPIVVIKSTVTPGTTARIAYKYTSEGRRYNGHPEMKVCFSPEFLTEANSFEDFKNQSRIIIGGSGSREVKQMFMKAFPDIPIELTLSETAEMVKYFTNCFLAAKVTFANQMFQICLDNNIDYDKVCEYALYDERIGKSHLAVPGPDGDLGFGGHCFPKDLSAMISFGSLNDGDTDFLKSIQYYNDKCRMIRDWEGMKGRAVSED
jgi:UDPglucose 6-dehydrogenase